MTPFSKRVQILTSMYQTERDTAYEDFIQTNDLGFPAAVLLTLGAVTLTDTGTRYVNDTFDALCDLLGIDRYGDFDNLDQMEAIANE